MYDVIERLVPHRKPVIVAIHVVLVSLAYLLAFLLRLGGVVRGWCGQRRQARQQQRHEHAAR